MCSIPYLSEKDETIVSEILITLVQNVPMLYDKSVDKYKDKNLRKQKFSDFVDVILQSTGVRVKKGNTNEESFCSPRPHKNSTIEKKDLNKV